MKLKGLIHDIILGISVFSVCVCYFFIGAPTPIKASVSSNGAIAQKALALTYQTLLGYTNFNADDYKYFMVSFDTDYIYNNDYFIDVVFIPTDSLVTTSLSNDGKLTNYGASKSSTHDIYVANLSYNITKGEVSFTVKPYEHDFFPGKSGLTSGDHYYFFYGIFNLSDGTRFDNTVQPDYCTFTYLTDHEKLSDLLVEINTTPEAKQTVMVTTDRGSAITCMDKSTNKVYTVGEYPIINGVPSFALGHSKCKDEQIPTDDNNYFFQKDVPTENNEEYHAVCEYDNQLVYEFKKGSTGGGIDPDDIPDYGIFTPLVELLKGLGYWLIELIKGMFEFLFAPSENFLSDKFNELYTSFGTKFPFIAQIKPISDSVINLFNNSSASPPNLSLTLPDIFGGGEFTIINLDIIVEYRTLIHGIILFLFCTNYLFDLPRKVSSALGEDK